MSTHQSTPTENPGGDRPPRSPAAWEPAFLAALRRTGNVSKSASLAGTTRRNAYKTRANHPDFAEAWDEAYETFVDELEEEAHRRAFSGVASFRFTAAGQPILDPVECRCRHAAALHEGHEGKCAVEGCACGAFLGLPYYEVKYANDLMQLLLRGHRSARYMERLNVSSEDLNAAIELQAEKLRLAAVAAAGATGAAGAADGAERGGGAGAPAGGGPGGADLG